MALKISVRFVIENIDYEISADADMTVLQFKELLGQQIPFLHRFPSISPEVLKLTLKGSYAEGSESSQAAGIVMEEVRPLKWYFKGEESHCAVLLSLERPVEKISCQKCHQPFVQWSRDRLCCGDVNEKEDEAELEKRKSRIPQLLNCGHSVCSECLRDCLEQATDEADADPESTPKAEAAVEEIVGKFVCPTEGCGMVSYWRRDREWRPHEGMQRLVHLMKREWTEAAKARGRCFSKTCGAEALLRCSDCNDMKYCLKHFEHMHKLDEFVNHNSQLLLSSEILAASDAFITRFCCYCGGGETATCEGGGGRPHCEHRDTFLSSATNKSKSQVIEQLEMLAGLQVDCWRQLVAWNGIMDRLQEHRVKGVERIRAQFDDLIARLEARKEDMMSELRRCYRVKEIEVMEKMDALGVLTGELEAGLMHYRQSLKVAKATGLTLAQDTGSGSSRGNSTKRDAGGEEMCVVRDVVDVDSLRAMVSHLTSGSPEDLQTRFGEISIEFSESNYFVTAFCQISSEFSASHAICRPFDEGMHTSGCGVAAVKTGKIQDALTKLQTPQWASPCQVLCGTETAVRSDRSQEFPEPIPSSTTQTSAIRDQNQELPAPALPSTTQQSPKWTSPHQVQSDAETAIRSDSQDLPAPQRNYNANSQWTSPRQVHSDAGTVVRSDHSQELLAPAPSSTTQTCQWNSPRQVISNLAVEVNEASLFDAARKGDLEVVAYLVRNGIDVNCKNEAGETPLHVSAYDGHLKVMECLPKWSQYQQ